MLDIEFTEAAENDLADAQDWYDGESQTLGDRFIVEVRHQLRRIGESHLQFPLVRRDARRANLRDFPYGIIFRIAGNTAYIVAIFHFSRNPGIWKKRV